ncbi:MAG: transposase [Pseudomonadota bacterium]|nr:transposase [Pseudomonadota bacterium]
MPCRLVLVKRVAKGRHQKTLRGKNARNSNSLKSAASQTEPWLLGVSPNLAELTAKEIVEQYGGRMQIEQTFRDLKNPRWGLALTHTQTRCPKRLAILLVIGALIIFALWLIGLAARAAGYRVEYGSKKNARCTLSVISLARSWIREWGKKCQLTRHQIKIALDELRSQVRHL